MKTAFKLLLGLGVLVALAGFIALFMGKSWGEYIAYGGVLLIAPHFVYQRLEREREKQALNELRRRKQHKH